MSGRERSGESQEHVPCGCGHDVDDHAWGSGLCLEGDCRCREPHPPQRRRGFLIGANQRDRRLTDSERLRIRDGVRSAMRRLP